MDRAVAPHWWVVLIALAAVQARQVTLAAWVAGAALWPISVQALGPAAPFTPPQASTVAAATGTDAAANGAGHGSKLGQTAEPADTKPAAAAAFALAGSAGTEGFGGMRLGPVPMALIDGQWWRLGSRPRGARLAAITRQGAWLVHGDGRRELLAIASSASGGASAAASRLVPSAQPATLSAPAPMAPPTGAANALPPRLAATGTRPPEARTP